MNCLDNRIGLRDIDTDPDSGLYINDLEGITTAQISKLKDDVEDYEDTESAWEQIYRRAQWLFDTDIRMKMKKYLKPTSIRQNIISGQINENTNIATTAFLRGHFFDFPETSHDLELHLNYAQVYLTAAASFSVFIYEATTGILLDTVTKTSAGPGLVRLDLLKNYAIHEYPRLFVCIDHEGLATKKADDYDINPMWYTSTNEISNASTPVYGSLSSASIALILNYHVRCSMNHFICQHIDLLTTPFMYKLAIEIMKERLGSDQVNQFTLNRDQANELRDSYKIEYENSLNEALEGLRPQNGVCFQCNHAVTRKLLYV